MVTCLFNQITGPCTNLYLTFLRNQVITSAGLMFWARSHPCSKRTSPPTSPLAQAMEASEPTVMSCCSPVFQSMFSHNLKERQLSAVHIPDMSVDECQCFINYMYGNLQERDFIAHRVALLGAAEKYDISDLKAACVDSLSQDIDTENLIERLQVADLYQLQELKRSCIRLLMDFMKVYEIRFR